MINPKETWNPLDWNTAVYSDGILPRSHGCIVTFDPNLKLRIQPKVPAFRFYGQGYMVIDTDACYIQWYNVNVGFTIRTEYTSGLLAFLFGGSGSYFLVQLVSGHLFWQIVTIDGLINNYTSDMTLCDGNLYAIRLTSDYGSKQLNVKITRWIDMKSEEYTFNINWKKYLILAPLIYVGGIPPGSEADQFIRQNNLQDTIVSNGFNGCFLENLLFCNVDFFQDEMVDVAEVVNVDMSGCPEIQPGQPSQSCVDSSKSTEVIYNNTGYSTLDQNLMIYTEYMYKVEVVNPAGLNSSKWVIARTAEGPPQNVPKPIVGIISTSNLPVSWPVMPGYTGAIIHYTVRLYLTNNLSYPAIEMTTAATADGDTFSVLITTAIPFTNYTVKLIACTAGGCNESADGFPLTTPIDAPWNVNPPKRKDFGTTYIDVAWDPPGYINGPFLGYILYMENTEVYTGLLTTMNVTDLSVFTTYTFYLKACNNKTCNTSSFIRLSTDELPPSSLDPPQLTYLGAGAGAGAGTGELEVNWTTPSSRNGILNCYLIYVSLVVNEPGDIVYNSSEIDVTLYVISDLALARTYYISVAACTTPGCTISNQTEITLPEGSPAGVSDPIVTSPNSTSLVIKWSAPSIPNGVITDYQLYHNDLLMSHYQTPQVVTLTDLQPWSLHTFRLKCCTAIGCSSSKEVSFRTQEAVPQGSVILSASADNARTINALWSPVQMPNGLVYYDVYVDGSFYVDQVNSNFTVILSRRSLFRTNSTLVVGQWISITDLVPYSSYNVQVNGSNTKGYILSNIIKVILPAAEPDGVFPPTLTSTTPTSIIVTWNQVMRLNSNQSPTFQLQYRYSSPDAVVHNLFATETTAMTYTLSGLLPYTSYSFRIRATNNYGFKYSDWSSLFTRQDKPSGVSTAQFSDVQSRSIQVSWQPPMTPNGIITMYNLYQNGSLIQTTTSNVTTVKCINLIPFTTYIYCVEACTVAGCTKSVDSPATTLIAVPDGIQPPSLVSQTSTSILITWTPPLHPNGILQQYEIRRRLYNQSNTEVSVKTFLPSDPLLYVDSSDAIQPYTMYEYEVAVYSSGNVGYSSWAEVITKSARPGGVQAPTVTVLNSTSLLISWTLPQFPNGLLQSFIVSLPMPRYTINNVSQTSITVVGLIPFTNYNVMVTTCTDGGCTASITVPVTTNPALPDGISPPSPTTISQTYISVSWQQPVWPNGPNIHFELLRTKLRQPLQAVDPSEFNHGNSVYSGTATTYEDRNLTLFTTYFYEVTVFNSFGQVTSNRSQEVTTYGGTPTQAANISVSPVNYTTVRVNWTVPDVLSLQGSVDKFNLDVIYINSTSGALPKSNQSFQLNSTMTSLLVINLLPVTTYKFVLTMLMYGGATTSSSPVLITTANGVPAGVSPPSLSSLSDTSLRVSWVNPNKPNGQIAAFYIYVNGIKYDPGTALPGSYVVSGLKPYTVYQLQIEACTIYGCSKSDAISATTAESIPANMSAPLLSVGSSSSIFIAWNIPAQPNGIIVRYELYRKAKINCGSGSPSLPDSSRNDCSYLQCGILEGICGNQCYSGFKTCCGGVIYAIQPGLECCETSYIQQRTSPSYVCCGGQFHLPLPNYQCCKGWYVLVMPGQVCCPDSIEDRTTVGYGDQCCGSIPYSSQGSQLCCGGQLYDAFNRQCCNGKMIDASLICCGSLDQQWYAVNNSKFCCGSQYVDVATSICCTDGVGNSKLYTFQNELSKNVSNQKCCGSGRISISLSCCNTVGYDPTSQVCADVSTGDSGCGTGTICPASQSMTSYCDSCSFNRAKSQCFSYNPKTFPLNNTLGAGQQIGNSGSSSSNNTVCFTDSILLYSGMQLYYTDTGLAPYSEYQYTVSAFNGAGSVTSPPASATTLTEPPQGMNPPECEVKPNQPNVIYISWQPPSYPNGPLLWYVLLRDTIEIFRTPSVLTYTDNNAIVPYKIYTYVVSACTSSGCIQSSETKVMTVQGRPGGLSIPTVFVKSSTSLVVNWTAPANPNGVITQYVLTQQTPEFITIANFTGNSALYSYSVNGLVPFTTYQFYVTACTAVGCTNSDVVGGMTLQDKPNGVFPPQILIISPGHLEILWQAPSTPNGVILSYIIYRSAGGLQLIKWLNFTSDIFNASDDSVIPMTRYGYMVEARTVAGGSNSTVSTVNIPLVTPVGIPAPSNVTVLSSTSIFVEWDPVYDSNYTVDQYNIMLNFGSSSSIQISAGIDFSKEVDNLQPFTWYSVQIQACFDLPNSCGTGPALFVQTFGAPPDGLPPPKLRSTGPSAVQISWQRPSRQNGIIRLYRINRRLADDSSTNILVGTFSGDSQSYTNAGPDLLPYTKYQYQVTAVNAYGETNSTWAQVWTLSATPQVLIPPIFSNISSVSFTVSWQAPLRPNGVITSYRLDCRPVSSDPSINALVNSVSVSGATLTTSISGLLPYTQYMVAVTAVNLAGSLTSNWTSISTNQAAPAGLSQFQVEKMTDGLSVILQWSSPVRPNGLISSYFVYRNGSVNPVYQGLNLLFEYTGLQPFTLYVIQLEACTLGGCARSPWQSFYTAQVSPQGQPAPSLSASSGRSVTIQWVRPPNTYGNILMYSIYRQSSSQRKRRSVSNGTLIYSTNDGSKDQYSYTDTTVQPFTNYQYKIRTTNSVGSSDSPWTAVSTPQAPPTLVSPPTVLPVSSQYDRLLIQWTEPAQPNGVIQSYQLQRNSTVPLSFSWNGIKQYIDVGLNAYTVYTYTITVCTGGGCTTSLPTTARTPESAPMSVAPPNVSNLNSTALFVSWSAPQITNGQLISYNLKLDNNVVYSGSGLSFVVSGLTPNRAYSLTISACTIGGCTESSSVIGKTDEAVPVGMAAPVLIVTSATSIEVSWMPPSQPNGVITSYELRRNTTLLQVTQQLQYVDSDVQPGMFYMYQVTAYNSKGGVQSPTASAWTYASSPVGMLAPVLEALSSSAFRASWQAPVKPNGIIVNYTLFNSMDIAYVGLSLTYVVIGLSPWTNYTVRVQACTAVGCCMSDPAQVSTLAAPPANMAAPKLTATSEISSSSLLQVVMIVEWSPPGNPNGIISRYDVFRRIPSPLNTDSDTGQLIYSGISTSYRDDDVSLKPYTSYEYRIIAHNSEGQGASAWQQVQSVEGQPTGIPAPVVKAVSSRSITIQQGDPTQSNGIIRNYTAYVNGTLSAISTWSQLLLTQLAPSTVYSVYVVVCTLTACGTSPTISVRTNSELPQNEMPPIVANISSTSMDLYWSNPGIPNGNIIGFELKYKTSCPYPYADSSSQVVIDCYEGPLVTAITGLVYSAHVTQLIPFMVYEFQLQCQNEAGFLERPAIARNTTLPDAPVYRSDHPPKMQLVGNSLLVNWTLSFYINGPIKTFTLFRNGQTQYIGPAVYFADIVDTKNQTYIYYVMLTTGYGVAVTPNLIFDPTRPDFVGFTTTPQSTVALVANAIPVYQEVWFIAVMIIIGVIILIILIAILMSVTKRQRVPYVRERTPIKQKKAPEISTMFDDPQKINQPDEGFVHMPNYYPVHRGDHTFAPSEMRSRPHEVQDESNGIQEYIGFGNPAMTVHDDSSFSGNSIGLMDFSLNHLDKMSTKWNNDDDLSLNAAGQDSGLNSLMHGDEFDSDSDRPISIVREHTMFPESHV